jgi:ATP-binding cassette subfamily G (WHITE) protein 2 (SNQ2)
LFPLALGMKGFPFRIRPVPSWVQSPVNFTSTVADMSIYRSSILVAFGVFFLITYLSTTELNSGAAEFRSVVEFKRGAKNVPKVTASPRDVENSSRGGGDTATSTQAEEKNEQRLEVENSLVESLKTTDIMSWAHLTYHVNASGGERRRLLNDVTGWVVPGKLTALMGESGAGKVGPLFLRD